MKEAYIVAGKRSAVGKAGKGKLRFMRPDDMASQVISQVLEDAPNLDRKEIDDLIVGNAVPEAEQGMQMGRIISLIALGEEVPGFIVNRYCGSGLEAIAIASQRIQSGMADCIIAGGTESMSLVPVMGWKTALNYGITSQQPDYYTSMGLTAEQVAIKYGIKREDSDLFAFNSHQKAIAAIDGGKFKNEIACLKVEESYFDSSSGKRASRSYTMDMDEGPRKDTSLEVLAKLRPAFAQGGQVTAGNSSQTSDGAAFVILMSEEMLKKTGMEPIAKLKSYAVAGVEPKIMGIGPVKAVPKAVKRAGLKLNDIEQIELNEAFAAQSLAVMKGLDLDPDMVNVNGGAVALGHPLGCSGAKLSIQLFSEMKRRGQRYGMVTACVGGGQGVAGIYELL